MEWRKSQRGEGSCMRRPRCPQKFFICVIVQQMDFSNGLAKSPAARWAMLSQKKAGSDDCIIGRHETPANRLVEAISPGTVGEVGFQHGSTRLPVSAQLARLIRTPRCVHSSAYTCFSSSSTLDVCASCTVHDARI
eukprot:706885-Pleurochrysis_carterae.AAC.2